MPGTQLAILNHFAHRKLSPGRGATWGHLGPAPIPNQEGNETLLTHSLPKPREGQRSTSRFLPFPLGHPLWLTCAGSGVISPQKMDVDLLAREPREGRESGTEREKQREGKKRGKRERENTGLGLKGP